jgi:hypothetical protein
VSQSEGFLRSRCVSDVPAAVLLNLSPSNHEEFVHARVYKVMTSACIAIRARSECAALSCRCASPPKVPLNHWLKGDAEHKFPALMHPVTNSPQPQGSEADLPQFRAQWYRSQKLTFPTQPFRRRVTTLVNTLTTVPHENSLLYHHGPRCCELAWALSVPACPNTQNLVNSSTMPSHLSRH